MPSVFSKPQYIWKQQFLLSYCNVLTYWISFPCQKHIYIIIFHVEVVITIKAATALSLLFKTLTNVFEVYVSIWLLLTLTGRLTCHCLTAMLMILVNKLASILQTIFQILGFSFNIHGNVFLKVISVKSRSKSVLEQNEEAMKNILINAIFHLRFPLLIYRWLSTNVW